MSLFLFTPAVELFLCPSQGQVAEAIAPHLQGRVKFQSSIWPARFHPDTPDATANRDDSVMVVGREGITLLVSPRAIAEMQERN